MAQDDVAPQADGPQPSKPRSKVRQKLALAAKGIVAAATGVGTFLAAKGAVSPDNAFTIGAHAGGFAGGLVMGATAKLPDSPQQWAGLGVVAVAPTALEFVEPATSTNGAAVTASVGVAAGRGLRHMVDKKVASMRARRGGKGPSHT